MITKLKSFYPKQGKQSYQIRERRSIVYRNKENTPIFNYLCYRFLPEQNAVIPVGQKNRKDCHHFICGCDEFRRSSDRQNNISKLHQILYCPQQIPILQDNNTNTSAESIHQLEMGKGSRKEKAVRPPQEPPKVAYFLFRDEVYDEVKTNNKDMNRGDLAEFINNQWDKLDKAKRQEYEEKLKTQKQQFQKDIQQYERKYGELPDPTETTKVIKENKTNSCSAKKHRKETNLDQHGDQDGEKQSKKVSKKKKVVDKGEGRIKGNEGRQKKKEAEKNKNKGKRKTEDNTREMWVVDKNARSDEDE